MLSIESLNEKLQNNLETPIPSQIIKTRRGSHGEDLKYISGRVVADILNHAFGYNWSWEVKNFWKEPSEPYYFKDDKKHENGLPQNPVIHCLGTLSVYLKDETGKTFVVKKDGFGSKTVVGAQSDQEDNYKAAATDAMKKAATLFGVAAQFYRTEPEQTYFEVLNDPWEDEEIFEQYASERKFLKDFMERKKIDFETLNDEIKKWSEDRYDELQSLPPKKFAEFVKYLMEAEK